VNTAEFIKQVQSRAALDSRDEAMKATRATLEALGQRLFGGEPQDLAAQLPRELADCLRQGPKSEAFDLSEFYQRISRKEGVEIEKASAHARAVIEVLCEAVTQGEIDDICAQLPGDFAALFKKGGGVLH
jgi:uncharacterized protein (DUF2267 family)